MITYRYLCCLREGKVEVWQILSTVVQRSCTKLTHTHSMWRWISAILPFFSISVNLMSGKMVFQFVSIYISLIMKEVEHIYTFRIHFYLFSVNFLFISFIQFHCFSSKLVIALKQKKKIASLLSYVLQFIFLHSRFLYE